MAFSAIMGLLVFVTMPPLPNQFPELPEMPQGLGFMMGMFRYFVWFVLAQLALAAVAIVAGIQFLQLRPWARAALEILSWASLIYVVGFGLFWISTWSTMTKQFAQQDVPIDMEMFRTVGIAIAALITLAFAIPLGIMIKYLRGKVVRQAMLRQAPPAHGLHG